MKKNKTRDIFVVGFALFAIFFGAGNLIFPPKIGVIAGDRWWKSMLGFLLADPLLPIVGVLVTAKVGGQASRLGSRIGKRFTDTLFGIIILIMGPVFAIPRTAATTHEIAIGNNFPQIPIWVTSLVFLGLTLFFAINQSGVIDKIGKYLTPALLISLTIIILKAIINPIEPMVTTRTSGLFLSGFYEGYQTMDTLAAALMTSLVVDDLLRRGYTDYKERMRAVRGVSVVVIILLAFVYGGLTYLGATTGSMYNANNGMIEILLGAIHQLLGKSGTLIIAIGVAMACLTTSVGLTAIVGNFFQDISVGKIRYKHTVIVTVIVSFFISLLGVKGLVDLAGPVLAAMYPIMIALLFLNAFDKYIKHDWSCTGAVIATALVSIPESLNSAFGIMKPLVDYYKTLPLSILGFEWLIPAIIGAIIGGVVAKVMKKENKVIEPVVNLLDS